MNLVDLDITTLVLPYVNGQARAMTVFRGKHYGIIAPPESDDHATILNLQTQQYIRTLYFQRVEDAVPALALLDALGPLDEDSPKSCHEFTAAIMAILRTQYAVMCPTCIQRDSVAILEDNDG